MQPGDCLLYAPNGFFGYLIAVKTWTKIAHVEVYAGDGQCWASRDGQGVGLYPLRERDRVYTLRPTASLCLDQMAAWFATVNGQAYDWFGLLRFIAWGSVGGTNNGKMFCSEFATRLYRAGGFDAFNGCDADAVSPSMFLTNSAFRKV